MQMIASKLSYVPGPTKDRDLLFVEWNPFFPRHHGVTAFLRDRKKNRDGKKTMDAGDDTVVTDRHTMHIRCEIL